MAKLYFRYGAMGCGKTRDLIKVWYNYKENGKNAIIVKPSVDTKAGINISSRDGMEHKVDLLIGKRDNVYKIISKFILTNNLDCILVDEAQFLERKHVEQFADIVDYLNIPVICYGLRADFKNNLFVGSHALFIYADVIEEMKTICRCLKNATRNVRFVNGKIALEGGQIAIDGEDKVTYEPMCRKCQKEALNDARKERLEK